MNKKKEITLLILAARSVHVVRAIVIERCEGEILHYHARSTMLEKVINQDLPAVCADPYFSVGAISTLDLLSHQSGGLTSALTSIRREFSICYYVLT